MRVRIMDILVFWETSFWGREKPLWRAINDAQRLAIRAVLKSPPSRLSKPVRPKWGSAEPLVHRNDGTTTPFNLQEQQAGTDHMPDDTEVAWHREQIAKNRAILEELEAGNTDGSDVFPETRAEMERLKAQIAQSELIVVASERMRG